MSYSRMQRNIALLELLYKSPPSVRRNIICNASMDFINALCEISLNVLKGVIPLTDQQYRQLKKKKSNQTGCRQKGQNVEKEKIHQPIWRIFATIIRGCHTLHHQSYSKQVKMEHTQKMFLVPQHQLDMLNHQQQQHTGSVRHVEQNERDKAMVEVLQLQIWMCMRG